MDEYCMLIVCAYEGMVIVAALKEVDIRRR